MQNTAENKYSFKVVLLGEGCVGKTSLVRNLLNLLCSVLFTSEITLISHRY